MKKVKEAREAKIRIELEAKQNLERERKLKEERIKEDQSKKKQKNNKVNFSLFVMLNLFWNNDIDYNYILG